MGWAWFDDLVGNAKTALTKYNNKDFKEGSMAVCALIAAADGSIDPSEKTKVAGFIGKNEMLQVFDPTELRDIFLKDCDLASDEFSRLELFKTVRKLKGTENADMAVKVALIIANADGDFADSEKVVVKEICQTLGLNPNTYGV